MAGKQLKIQKTHKINRKNDNKSKLIMDTTAVFLGIYRKCSNFKFSNLILDDSGSLFQLINSLSHKYFLNLL